MPRRTRFPVRSGAVHNKEWDAVCLTPTQLDLAIGTSAAFTLFTNDRSETLLRMRGQIHWHLDASVVNELATIAMGIAVVSATAAAAGAVPVPGTDGAYPWLWHGWTTVASLEEAAITPNFLSTLTEVDSKAMRKMKEEEVIALVVEVCSSLDQGGNVQIAGGFRALVGY